MPAVPTKTREAKKSALLLAPQTAEGTIASDFTTGGAIRLRTAEDVVDTAFDKNDGGGLAMTQSGGDDVSSRYTPDERPEDSILVEATDDALDLLLRSNWGPPTAGVYALGTQISEWFTLAYVESVVAADALKLIRIRDAFFHRLTLRLSGDPLDGVATVLAEYMGRRSVVGVNGDATLPAMTALSGAPASEDVFASRGAVLTVDPGGIDVDVRWSLVEAVLDQRGRGTPRMTGDGRAILKTKSRPAIRFEGEVSAESFALLEDARAGTTRQIRLNLPGPVKTLTLDFFNAVFAFGSTGRRGDDTIPLVGEAVATVGAGSFVTVTLV